MNIAKLDKRVELLKPVVTDDGYGGQNTEYYSQGMFWAEIKSTDYAEQQAQGTPMNREQLRFRLRPLKNVRRGWLMEYCDERYVVDVVDNTYSDSTTLIVRRYELGV